MSRGADSSRRLLGGATILLTGALVWVLVGSAAAPSAPALRYASYSAPTFVPVDETKHNNTGNSACGSFKQHAAAPTNDPNLLLADENKGDLNTNRGSFLADVHLSQGATVRKFSLFANDNDAEDSFAFLIRKRIEGGLEPQFKGYVVMASTRTSGAVNNRMRKFTDPTVNFARIDNSLFVYNIELVNCSVIEPFAVQLGFDLDTTTTGRQGAVPAGG